MALALLAIAPLAHGAGSAPRPARIPQRDTPRLSGAAIRAPLWFEPNQGQTDPQVCFLSRAKGGTLFLTSDEAVLALPAAGEAVLALPAAGEARQPSALRMRLTGAKKALTPRALAPQPGKSNYLVGTDRSKWRKNVPHYGRVRCAAVYPGIDLDFYGSGSQYEYDLTLAPGADPAKIRLRFTGAEKVTLDQGDLLFSVGGHTVRQKRPVVYQEAEGIRQPVEGCYTLCSIGGLTEVGFRLGRYDRSRPLVIDPVLEYGTYLGGDSTEHGWSVAVDSAGSFYLGGRVDSGNFPTTVGAYRTTLNGGASNAFITKLNAAGTQVLYSTYFGSPGGYARAIAVDGSGAVSFAGYSPSGLPVTAGAYDRSYGGGGDAFFARLDPTGSTLQYCTYIGGGGTDIAVGLELDPYGHVYVAGSTTGASFPLTTGAYTTSWTTGVQHVFVVKLDPASATPLLFASHWTGTKNELDFALGADGTTTITGKTPTTDSLADVYVARLSADGSSLLYSRQIGGSAFDEGTGVAVSDAGEAYLTGTTRSADYPTTAAAWLRTLEGPVATAPFVTFLDAAGNITYSTFLPKPGFFGGRIARAEDGRILLACIGRLTALHPGSDGLCMGTLSPDGKTLLDWSNLIGAKGMPRDIALAGGDAHFVTGWTDSRVFPTTAGAVQPSIGTPPTRGDSDAFLIRVGPSPTAPPTGLSAQWATDRIRLTWLDPSGIENGFRLERYTDPVEGNTHQRHTLIPARSGTGGTVQFDDTDITAGTRYYYRVCAYVGDGSLPAPPWETPFPYSRVASATAQNPSPLSAPSSLTAEGILPTKIRLRWLDNAPDEDGFRLERSPDGSTGWAAIALRPEASDAGSTVEFIDDGRTTGTRYWYRVRAYQGDGTTAGSVFSAFSNVADARTPGPGAPTNLTAAAVDSIRIRVRWKDNAPDENGFRLERSPNGSTSWIAITLRPAAAGVGSTVEYIDPHRSPGTTYWYRVRAYIGDGTTAGSILSAYSNTASATTP
jgi:hypothetical protein